MFISRKFLIFQLLLAFGTIMCDDTPTGQSIVLFVKSLHKELPQKAPEPSLFHPGKIQKQRFKKMVSQPRIPYLFALYGGHMGFTDENGQILFPRQTQNPHLDIFVTPSPEPYLQPGTNNVLFWRVPENVSVNRYSATREKDKETNLTYWNIEASTIAPTRIIPLHSIILIAKPSNVLVPEGITLTTDGQHFILPLIYVKPKRSFINDSLLAMNLKIFFDPIRQMYKPGKLSISQMIDPSYKGSTNETSNSL